MQADSIPAALSEATARVSALLHLPHNLGVELRHLCLPTQPETRVLIVFIAGVAKGDLVQSRVIAPLQRSGRQPGAGRLCLGDLELILPAPGLRRVGRLDAAIDAVLSGETALLLDGATEATVIATAEPVTHPVGALVRENPYTEIFGTTLLDNVALIRTRLQDRDLIAEPQDVPRGLADAAVLYLDGKAPAALVERMRSWVRRRGSDEALRQGKAAGRRAIFGLLPELMTSVWPDRAAILLGQGYVLVLVDQTLCAYVAPVTMGALLTAPSDHTLRQPLHTFLPLMRLVLAGVILLAPAAVVAVLNYHHEMIPTPFVLGLASQRENASLPIVAEVILLQVIWELLRAATLHLPLRITPGASVISVTLLYLLMVLAGSVGPVAAITSSLVAIAHFSIPSPELLDLVRTWRWYCLLGAAVFGLFGMATVNFLLANHLSSAESWGVPVLEALRPPFSRPTSPVAARGAP